MKLCRRLSWLFLLTIVIPSGICAETVKVPETQAQLRGLAEFEQVSIKASPVGSKLFANCRPSAFRYVHLEVINNLATPILLNGDQAQAVAEAMTLSQASEKEVIADSGCDLSAFRKACVAAVAIASAGLAGPIASEIAHKTKDPGMPLGTDGLRLGVEEIRLGKRVLMPGETTRGLLCFLIPATSTVTDALDVKITIPVVTKAPEEVFGQVEVRTSLLK